ncbi:MAG: hypothetical protein KBA40_02385 [Candidatus Peribacteraceae bacterium]|nr:hypothetical protein [Candidatus Peribacteraceae bacterium]MBP9850180.1 hypothetical protein [Candidatus Peribacteraceae bacterium]
MDAPAENSPEKKVAPVEIKDPISTDIRTKLDAAKAALSAEAPADTSGFTQLALTNLAEAMATEDRAAVSARLKTLRNDANFTRLSPELRDRLNGLQAEVETKIEKGARLSQEGAGAVKGAVDELHPALKTGIYGVTILAGSKLVMKTWKAIKNFFIGAGKRVGEGAVAAKKKGGTFLRKTWNVAKVALGIGGVAAIGKVGYDTFLKKEAVPDKTVV